MTSINTPLLCLTADVDWTSEYALKDFVTLVHNFHIKPTIFATHRSELLEKSIEAGAIEIGIHPNFLPGSSHGNDADSVIEHICGLYPTAKTFRSHCFFDNTRITETMARRGFAFDSNLCLYMQPDLVPLRHQSGLIRFPVFWEDDVHWCRTGGDWQFEKYAESFFSPGLKILNVHPFTIAANIPNGEYYSSIKMHIKSVNSNTINQIRFAGDGARTFLISLLEAAVKRGESFYTLAELYQMLHSSSIRKKEDAQGRHTTHTDEEFREYWAMTEAQRQAFLKKSYEVRNPTDFYATSRDHNLRELEILALKRHVNRAGKILDLGCGNGYTLISLARAMSGCHMTGIDFTGSLIQATNILGERERSLKNKLCFICADAIEHIRQCTTESLNYIITERFLNNLPSPEAQREVIRHSHRALVPGGMMLMCEGSESGFDALNDIRAAVGLSRIPARSGDNISAIRFKDAEVDRFATEELGFTIKAKEGFGMYFVIARVLHPLLVSPQRPRFDARINDLARIIQESVPLEPTYGSSVLWVLEKAAASED